MQKTISPSELPTEGTRAALCIQMLGSFEARLNGTPLLDLKAREGARLLAYLLLQQNRSVSATAVAELFWPETGSLDSLRQSVRHIRGVLGSEGYRLESARGIVAFKSEGADIDIITFNGLIAMGDGASLQRAVELYNGPLLSDWEERWVIPYRERGREKYHDALDFLAIDDLNKHEYSSAIRWLKRSLKANPSKERIWCDLMRTQVLAGERTAALDLYRRCSDYLHGKYHLEPPVEMTALFHDIRENTAATNSSLIENEAPREPVGGAVPPGSPLYIERPADELFLAAIARRESIVLVKGPRQTGKSSLLARGLHHARRTGAVVLVTDFEQLTPTDLATMDSLCLRLIASLAAQMDLDILPENIWKPLLGPGVNLERFLLKHVIGSSSVPVVWGLDEVDRVFPCPYSGEFFSLLRSWHEKRSLEPGLAWKRVTLALACATEAHLYIRDLNHSPFNVGSRLNLGDFTEEQVDDLNSRHDAVLKTASELTEFYELTGGHPYIVRSCMLEMLTLNCRFGTLCDNLKQDKGPFSDHLRRLTRLVTADNELRDAVMNVLENRPCPDESFYRLQSAGVLVGNSGSNARLRCGLYSDYLRKRL